MKKKRKKEKRMKMKTKKEYILVIRLVGLSQVIWLEACWHKSFIPSQFKVPFDFNELYQSIKIFWSFGSVKLSPISKEKKKKKSNSKISNQTKIRKIPRHK